MIAKIQGSRRSCQCNFQKHQIAYILNHQALREKQNKPIQRTGQIVGNQSNKIAAKTYMKAIE